MRSFLPQKVTFGKIKKNYEIIDPIIYCADISGFTNMSEKLAGMGKEGSEEVTRIINLFFKPLVEIILKYNGDIFYFGGDAITAVFDKNKAYNALAAAYDSVEYVKTSGHVKTSRGNFDIGIHIALNRGKAFFQDTGKGYILAGESCFKVISLLDIATKGETIISRSVKELVPDMKCTKAGQGNYKVVGIDKRIVAKSKMIVRVKKDVDIENEISELTPYFPGWMKKQIEQRKNFEQWDGEHRKATIIFMHFRKIPFDKNKKTSAKMSEGLTEALRVGIDKFGGWINKIDFYNDGIRALIVFGFPTKHDNDEKHAVLFTQEIIDNVSLKDISISVGINSGSIFITPVGSASRMELTVMGDAVNTAARIASKSAERKITVSESVYENTRNIFEYGKPVARSMKGKAMKVKTYEFININRTENKNNLREWLSESRKLVGNKELLGNFPKAVTLVKKKKSAVFTLEGEAGLGKSRIIRELEKNLAKDKFIIHKGNCLSYGRPLSYHPWVDVLKRIFGILDIDSPEEKKRKITSYIINLDPALKMWLPVIGEVVGEEIHANDFTKSLESSVKMQKFFEIMLDIIKDISRKTPLCIVLEDMHWADNSSTELLTYLIKYLKNEAVLFLLALRPVKHKLGFKIADRLFENRIKELSNSDTEELIEDLLQVKFLPDDLKNLVLNKSQGNPFYVEELVKSLIEQGVISNDLKSGWIFRDNIKSVVLPDSVEGVILSRIDRLDIADREMLQTASVLGREFEKSLLQKLAKDKERLSLAMENLKYMDLIQADDNNPERYLFKHILTCETAYNTLSFARKRDIHEHIGNLLEKTGKRKKNENLGMLSYHYHNAQNFKKSMNFSMDAGDQAVKVYSNYSAMEYFDRAIEAYSMDQSLADHAAVAYAGRANVFLFLGEYEKAIADSEQSVKIAKKLDDEKLLARCLIDLSITNEITHRADKMKESAETALNIFEKLNDKYGMARSYNYIGMFYGANRDFKTELDYLKKSYILLQEILEEERNTLNKNRKRKLKKYPATENSAQMSVILNNTGFVQRSLGDNENAIINYKTSLAIRRDVRDKMGEGQSLNNIGMFYARQNQIKKGMKYFLRSVKIFEEIGNKKGLSEIYQNLGALNYMMGEKKNEKEYIPIALEYLFKALEIRKALDDKHMIASLMLWLGKCYIFANDLKNAEVYFKKCLQIQKKFSERAGEAVALFWIGKVYGAENNHEQQMKCSLSALKIYEKLNSVKEQINIINQMIPVAEKLNDIKIKTKLTSKLNKLTSNF